MKDKIKNLLKSPYATLRVNEVCTLLRFTKDIHGNPCDQLIAQISIFQSSQSLVEIESRKVRGIVEEIADAQIRAYTAAVAELNKHLYDNL